MVGEGDRLANLPFFTAVQELGWQLTVVYLEVPMLRGMERYAARGVMQSQQWWKGRITHMYTLVSHLRPAPITLDAFLPPSVLSSRIAALPHIAALRGLALPAETGLKLV